MALDLTPEQRKLGQANFQRAAEGLAVTPGPDRREFMKTMVATGGVVGVTSAAAYFGYTSALDKPVKTALIGGGDEGGVLMGEHDPKFNQIVAVCDIRPHNMKRIFDGEPAPSPRKGLKHHYGANCDDGKTIRKYTDYKDMLQKEKDVEAVIVALPLHLHAPVSIACLEAGKHVLCEKLMAWNVTQCKAMIRAAEKANRILSIGHQRHYSMLYAQAREVLDAGVLGDIKYIRALWHRNNSWPRLDKEGKPEIDPVTGRPALRDGWCPAIPPEDRKALEADIRKYGYKSMEELVRWRLFNRTGAGLMAELGSHQLDACSIFLGKVHPLAVTGVGGRFFYGSRGENDGKPNPRESDDMVAVTYEFPGRNHPKGPNRGTDTHDVVVVTYTSMNTNGFEPYGETVMGSRGTMIVEQEASVMLYSERNPNVKSAADPKGTTVGVVAADGKKPALDTSSSYGPPMAAASVGGRPAGGPPSRGYREEMQDFAYCVRQWGQGRDKGQPRLPRCHGTVAMADAIIALTANLAMKHHQRIEFKDEWFDPKADEVPDAEMKPEEVAA